MHVYYAEEEADAEIKGRRPSISGPDRTFRRARRAWIVLLITCAFAFAVLLVCAIVLHRFPWVAQTWADILGIAVTILAAIQWIPQVYTTWHLGHLGGLSLVGLILQVPVSCRVRLPSQTCANIDFAVHLAFRSKHDGPSRLDRLERLDRLRPSWTHETRAHRLWGGLRLPRPRQDTRRQRPTPERKPE